MNTTLLTARGSGLKAPGVLKVPGAQIYYEVQGTGPVLAMIPGGPTDAGIFAMLADVLADRYTVVRYDPRGNSRSVTEGEPQDQDMDVHGDDAARLLQIFGSEPAFVLGSSGGAQIGLNLAARHGERVKLLVAHEPPCLQLLPDAAAHRAANVALVEVYRAEGAGPAMQKFMESTGLAGDTQTKRTVPPSPETLEAFGRIQGNLNFFFAHGMTPISQYAPDIARLMASPAKVVVGVGASSVGQIAYRTAVALAERLGTEPVSFPGGHGGYGDDPAGFGETLHGVLSGSNS